MFHPGGLPAPQQELILADLRVRRPLNSVPNSIMTEYLDGTGWMNESVFLREHGVTHIAVHECSMPLADAHPFVQRVRAAGLFATGFDIKCGAFFEKVVHFVWDNDFSGKWSFVSWHSYDEDSQVHYHTLLICEKVSDAVTVKLVLG